METWNKLRKYFKSISIFQTSSLMLQFGTLLIALRSYIDKHHK
ncbi:putative holin-like toxin [Liquorilactobacillus sicerae]